MKTPPKPLHKLKQSLASLLRPIRQLTRRDPSYEQARRGNFGMWTSGFNEVPRWYICGPHRFTDERAGVVVSREVLYSICEKPIGVAPEPGESEPLAILSATMQLFTDRSDRIPPYSVRLVVSAPELRRALSGLVEWVEYYKFDQKKESIFGPQINSHPLTMAKELLDELDNWRWNGDY